MYLLGHLQANRPSKGSASSYQHVYFKMDVPKAHNVAVVIGSDWTQLQQKQPGLWQAEVCHMSSTDVAALSKEIHHQPVHSQFLFFQ